MPRPATLSQPSNLETTLCDGLRRLHRAGLCDIPVTGSAWVDPGTARAEAPGLNIPSCAANLRDFVQPFVQPRSCLETCFQA